MHAGMEQLLAQDALAYAREGLATWREPGFAPGLSDEDLAVFITQAEATVARGGDVDWPKYEVTDQQGVTRSQRGEDHDGTRWRPSLEGAARLDLTLRAGSSVGPTEIRVHMDKYDTSIHIETDDDRIESLRDAVAPFFEAFVDPDSAPAPSTFKVFIGHGGDPQWKYLHRALNDIHGILAEAFESAERAGYHTLSVVDQMVRSSAVAVVVMTGELKDQDGTLRARENVVHEVGFCQGALGIPNTIVVLEEGVSEPSNIAGLTQVRFPPGRLIEVEDRIVEVLRQRQQVHNYQQG